MADIQDRDANPNNEVVIPMGNLLDRDANPNNEVVIPMGDLLDRDANPNNEVVIPMGDLLDRDANPNNEEVIPMMGDNQGMDANQNNEEAIPMDELNVPPSRSPTLSNASSQEELPQLFRNRTVNECAHILSGFSMSVGGAIAASYGFTSVNRGFGVWGTSLGMAGSYLLGRTIKIICCNPHR